MICTNKKLHDCVGENFRKIVFKKGPSLADKLINAQFTSNTRNTDNNNDIVQILADLNEYNDAVNSVHKCMTARCKCCTSLITGNKITCSITNTEYTISQTMSCDNTNVLYVIVCTKCKKQYVGETKRNR